ncbi:fkbp-type peptidyl-prolyl cis-trans isomerase [Plasmopara halstedii]|uniref:peptidylprolyl isomerase n=1 Tax=Plasmopara halstedii TaxID=4781 RepID=A0A0P1AH37_PLAHL|nr:fkbp-type peptidyl-prolyl cis-trans isomerase [Plasmopara halstedii]CEG39789.1 fkbp-type peptidyl-prolyl cis-trans isomerase [Plasmopara halstedii]|eukprot:XP_024576158.1 fkbp-type peptidyl-prolyl cis-trans isomerase [Plasmopara halstedii]
MVLMRRRDKRRGNEAEEIIVASDSTIVANKGVRSLSCARTGRFAADMRVRVGGYGRADKTWGLDHPWHSTDEGNLFSQLCAKDRMEEGAVENERLQEEPVLGLSRAQLKKRKAKLKKQGLTAEQAAEKALKEAQEAKERHEDEQKMTKMKELERREEMRKKRQIKRSQMQTQEKETQIAKDVTEKEKRKKEKEQKKLKKRQAIEQVEQQTKEQELEMQSREVLASAYEKNVGSEVTTKSGLVLQDQRIGQGKVPYLGEMLTVKYRGRLGQDGLVFGKGMLTTKYGTSSVIAGWEEGLGTMRPGGVRLLTIPPELGYGESGKGDKIPPHSTLFFEVELVRIGKRKRDVIGEDEMPLPCSFQRKRIKQNPGKLNIKEQDNSPLRLSRSQLKRRRRNRNKTLHGKVDPADGP